jgi:sulfur carrier protein ThiS
MKILFINASGGGFADYLEIEDGTTVRKLFTQQLPEREPEDILVRVNRMPVPADYVLQEGDRVSMTPTKVHGAQAA